MRRAARRGPRCGAPRGAALGAVAALPISSRTERHKYGTRVDDREPVARTTRSIFTAKDAAEADEKLKSAATHWRSVHPMLANWTERHLPEGFTAFGLPETAHRVRLRTTMGLSASTKRSNGAPAWPACTLIQRAACASSARYFVNRKRTGQAGKSIAP